MNFSPFSPKVLLVSQPGNGTIIYGIQADVYDPSSGYDNSRDAEIAIACGDAANNTDSCGGCVCVFARRRSFISLFRFTTRHAEDSLHVCRFLLERVHVLIESFSGWKFHREGQIYG